MNSNIESQINSLIGITNELMNVKSLSDSFDAPELNYINERLNDKLFRISVVGEFSSGKSTFINALIGKDILSHAVAETTAAITYIYNVPENDPKAGKAEIELRDGKVINLDSFDEIKDYTTAQSEMNVVELVKAVKIYVHFMSTDHPVLITDTPGLNGIAEHHQEITIDEVKKAHMCIYLLSLKGITNSDRDFIKYLMTFQNSFLFLQNFKDSLRSSEGETIDDKINEAEQIIKNNLISENNLFSYKVIGISALKALVSKDKDLKRIYEDDLYDLDDESRKRAYKESNFSEFESYLAELINTGEYRRVVVNSVAGRLETLLAYYLDGLLSQQELNDRLRSEDADSKKLEAIKHALEKLKNDQDDREKRLRNFIISKSEDNKRLLAEYSNEAIKEMYNNVCNDIDEKIKSFDDYTNFRNVYSETPERYFGKAVFNRLNSFIQSDLKEKIGLLLHNLSDEAMSRITSYVGSSAQSKSISFSVEPCTEVFRMDDYEYRTAIDKFRMELQNNNNKINELNRNITMNQTKLSAAEQGVRNAKAESSRVQSRMDDEIRAIGSKPAVKTWKTPREVSYRSKPGWDFLGWFEETHYKTVYDTHEDDSAQREWLRKKRAITEKYDAEIRKCKTAISDAEAKVSEINDDIASAQQEIKRREKSIDSLSESIRKQKELLEMATKINEKEFCNKRKNAMKSSIEANLFTGVSGVSVIESLRDYVSKEFDRTREIIIKQVVELYKDSVKKQQKSFEDMITADTQILEKRYESNEADIGIVSQALEKIRSIA